MSSYARFKVVRFTEKWKGAYHCIYVCYGFYMARPLRIEFPGAWYHVMNRGAGHRAIFSEDQYRSLFLELLGELNRLFHVETHAYGI